jgi:hypothetical protein
MPNGEEYGMSPTFSQVPHNRRCKRVDRRKASCMGRVA